MGNVYQRWHQLFACHQPGDNWLGTQSNAVVCKILGFLWLVYGTLSWKQWALSQLKNGEQGQLQRIFLKPNLEETTTSLTQESFCCQTAISDSSSYIVHLGFKGACPTKDCFFPNQKRKPESFFSSLFKEAMCQSPEKCLCAQSIFKFVSILRGPQCHAPNYNLNLNVIL